jgi:RNA polymerase sigma factor (sigma-70 family)
MAAAQFRSVLYHLGAACSTASDAELLERFRARRDEAAFTQLLRRHGPMVIGVGRRLLRQEADAEDVFQATFLLLARKASTIRKPESVGSWLHGVARHLALKAQSRAARRKAHERRAAAMRDTTATAREAWQELREALDQALQGLPEHHRSVLLLCYLEGRTQEKAARQLGCPLGTVRSRLARARQLLQARLTRRGLVLSAAALVTALSAGHTRAGVPARLLRPTLKAALQFAGGGPAPGLVSAGAARLAEDGLKTLFVGKARALAALALVLGLFVGGAGLLAGRAFSKPPAAATPGDAPRPAAEAPEGRADAPPADGRDPSRPAPRPAWARCAFATAPTSPPSPSPRTPASWSRETWTLPCASGTWPPA